MLKWIGRVVLALVVLAVVGVGGIYAASEVIIRRTIDTPLPVIAASSDADAVTRGAYLARIRGCDGCHERNLQGQVFIDEPMQGRLWAANLTRSIDHYSDAQLARAIRQGVRADGTALWIMPSQTWSTLSDRDTADIIAWLRSHPAAGQETPSLRVGPVLRLALVLGKLQPTTASVREAETHPAFDAGPQFARGRYLATTTCGECHGADLGGHVDNGEAAPDLIVASAYNREEFDRFLRTGIASDGKEKGFMSEIAKEHFGQISEQDLTDIHAYLIARAQRVPAA